MGQFARPIGAAPSGLMGEGRLVRMAEVRLGRRRGMRVARPSEQLLALLPDCGRAARAPQ
jgi:hypothetical protein